MTEVQHAVEMVPTVGRRVYVVAHGESGDVPHRVSRVEVTAAGELAVTRRHGADGRGPGPAELSWPAHVSLAAGDGRVVAADCDNDRVLLLDAQLRLERIVLTKDDDDIETPRRLCYVDECGWLMVGVNFGCVDIYSIKETTTGNSTNYTSALGRDSYASRQSDAHQLWRQSL